MFEKLLLSYCILGGFSITSSDESETPATEVELYPAHN